MYVCMYVCVCIYIYIYICMSFLITIFMKSCPTTTSTTHKTFDTYILVKGKGKVFPLQARLWPRRWVEVQLYSSMTAALEGGEWSAARSDRTLLRERPGTHCTGGWLGPRAGLDGLKISPHRVMIPGPSSP